MIQSTPSNAWCELCCINVPICTYLYLVGAFHIVGAGAPVPGESRFPASFAAWAVSLEKVGSSRTLSAQYDGRSLYPLFYSRRCGSCIVGKENTFAMSVMPHACIYIVYTVYIYIYICF